MNTLRLASPWLLALLPVVIAAIWAMARRRRHGDSRLRLPKAAATLRLTTSPWVRLEALLPLLRGGILILALVALARPQAGQAIEDVSTFGVDIVVALDISGSMRAEDFQPRNRLAVAKDTLRDFAASRPADRIGIVTFGTVAMTRCPLTLDHALLQQTIAEIDFAPPEQRTTAIGMGLATAVNRLRRSDARSRVVILATDGVNNAGQIGPKVAGEAARALGVRVYTIGVGRQGPVRVPIDGPFGTRYEEFEIPIDEPLLRDLAAMTGGQYFRAEDGAGLEQVLAQIDEMERTEITSRVRLLYHERFPLFLLPALGLLLVERLLSGTRLRRIP